jgi:hypothetical protein
MSVCNNKGVWPTMRPFSACQIISKICKDFDYAVVEERSYPTSPSLLLCSPESCAPPFSAMANRFFGILVF